MANQAFRDAGRRAATTMFGRSNSLSINTGAANSPLLVSSSTLPSTPTSAPRNPPRSRPSLIGQSIYTHQSTSAGPSKLRNEWKDDTPSTPKPDDYRKRPPHPGDSTNIRRDANASEAPWLDPKWKPPAGPSV